MYFPKYWTKAALKGPNREGEEWETEAWGWSDISEEEARQKALSRAKETLARLPLAQRGRGKQTAYYESSPCREIILEDLSKGEVRTVITRNSLGCDVLNTDSVGFADIDYMPPRVSIFASLFGLGAKKREGEKASWELQTLESLRNWQRENSSWSFRVYRTAGGLRLLAISKLLVPDGVETVRWLQAVGSDPLYQTLCRNQKSFRARLTPKPWRCKIPNPPMRSIWDAAAKGKAMEEWLEKYRNKATGFAVCEFLETIGSPTPVAECRATVELHDVRTSANSGMPLA
jgi:hypothetical protein